MPGIVGIISKTCKQKDLGDVQLMVNSMMHEPFYSSGIYENKLLRLNAGWITHQQSFSDCMPVFNEKKNIVLIYYGETFTDKETFDHLKAKNHRFDNRNASYLIHLYEENGIDFLKLLNGCFAGIIVDSVSNKIILFNDRFGMQRVFYHEGNDAFYFASEAKALLKICPELRNIDMRGLGELLCYDCVLENRTLFKNVNLLPCSAAWQFDQQGIIMKREYFSPEEWENQSWLEKEFFYRKLKETFTKILPRYFRSEHPAALALSGGLNSRIILANEELSAGKYPCYTCSGMYQDSYDVKIARRVASMCHQEHTTLKLEKDFLSDFSKYAENIIYLTDGYVDVSRAQDIYFDKIARNIAPVRIMGNYGALVLRDIGSKLKERLPMQTLINPDLYHYIKETIDTLRQINSKVAHPLTFSLFTEIPWLYSHGFSNEQSQITSRTPYLDNDLVSLMYRLPVEYRGNIDISLRLINDGSPMLGTIPTDRGFGGKRTLLLSHIQQQFLDFILKAECMTNYNMPQGLAKIDCVLKSVHFERLFHDRYKITNFRLWYREELSEYVKTMLLDEKTLSRPYLNRKTIKEMVTKHINGCCNYATEISKVLTLELTHRLLID